jgi:hypothetical protein
MMQTSAIPVPKPSDDEEVTWALSTAAALWTRGASADAVKWLRRAAQSANDLEDDGRAVELYKLAADLASSIPPPAPSSKAPPSNVRPVSHALSTPPPAPVAQLSTAAAHPSVPPRSSGVVATRAQAASAPPPPAWTPGVTVRPSGAPPPPTGRAALSSSIPPPSGRAAAHSVAPPASVRPSTLLPPPMPDAPIMAAPRSTPVPVIEMPTDTPLPATRSAAPAAGPFQKTPSAPPPVVARALSEPPSPISSPPAAYEVESELDLEVSSDEGLDALAAPAEAADGFHARVMIIPTSRRGELRLVIVPPGSNPPPDTLTGVLVPSAQHADTIRALLYGAG